jgi:non-canonical (house-cleaning) NTP pyrophosphatase
MVTVGNGVMIGVRTAVKIAALLQAVAVAVLLQEGGVVVDEDVAVLPLGSTSSARYATRRVTRPRPAGGGLKMMMMTPLMTRRPVLPHTG